MSAAPALPRRGAAPGAGLLLPFAGVAALAGGLAVVRPVYAVAVVLAVILGVLVSANTASLAVFLVFAMFVEALEFGPGLGVGRLAGGLALVVLALYALARGVAGLRPNLLLWVAGLYGLWLLASALWATSTGKVFSTFASYVLTVAYMLASAVLVRTRGHLTAIFVVLTVGSAVFGLVAFATYAASSSGRAAGLQGDPNFFAMYQVLAMAPALALAASARRRWWRLVLYGVIGVIVLSVVSSLSRTGLVALGLVVLATLALPWRIFFRRRGQKISYALALVLAGVAAALAGSARFVERAQTIISPSDNGSGRTDLWRAALRGWHEHPWLGLGAGNYQTHALDLLQSTPGVCTSCGYVTAGRVVHNAYLESLTELGPLGLALFVALILLTGRMLLAAFRRARAAGDPQLERYSLALLVSLLGYVAAGFFLSNELGRGLWVLIGLALALDVVTRRLPPALRPVYDPAVIDRAAEERERQLELQLQALVEDQRRLDLRRAALDERERSVARREEASLEPERISADRSELETLRRDLERLRDELAARSAALEAAERQRRDEAARLEARARELEQLDSDLRGRAAELEQRQRERAAQAQVRPAAPAPVEPRPAGIPVDALEPARGEWSLPALERAVAEHAAEFPRERVEEWEAYALVLREQAGMDGVLPASLDALVWEVYSDLIERVRG